jgi:hypothetical protein
MHMRGAGPTLSDTWHGNLTILGALCYLLAMGFAATVLGPRFRVYSIATMGVLIVFGILAGAEHARIAANLPSPTVGLWERVGIYATMLWIAVLAVSLLRARRDGAVGIREGGEGNSLRDRVGLIVEREGNQPRASRSSRSTRRASPQLRGSCGGPWWAPLRPDRPRPYAPLRPGPGGSTRPGCGG